MVPHHSYFEQPYVTALTSFYPALQLTYVSALHVCSVCLPAFFYRPKLTSQCFGDTHSTGDTYRNGVFVILHLNCPFNILYEKQRVTLFWLAPNYFYCSLVPHKGRNILYLYFVTHSTKTFRGYTHRN